MMRIDFGNRNRKVKPPKEELMKRYSTPGETVASMARHYKVTDATMKAWLCYDGIPRKTMKQNKAESDLLKQQQRQSKEQQQQQKVS
jgi:transposase-like protein